MTKEFNQVIKSYVSFLKSHNAMIENYILKFIPKEKKEQAKGVSGTVIKKMVNRHEVVDSQQIKEEE